MRWTIYISLLFILLSSCNGKKLNERLSLWRNDKIPYGTRVSHEQLNRIFPSAEVSLNKTSPVQNGFYNSDKENSSRSAFISIVPSFKPSDIELKALMHYVSMGNHVLISTFDIGQNVKDSLKFTTRFSSALFNGGDSLKLKLVNRFDYDTLNFEYPGASYDNSFDTLDQHYTTVIGYNGDAQPNFIRFELKSGGTMMIQLAPMGFTNFFLLHKDNIGYYNHSLSYIPSSVKEVYWDDYFRYYEYGKKKGSSDGKNLFSKLNVFMKDYILRWALILTAILFGLIYLFDSKRKQRVIPPVKPLSNASLDFVKTVGRLYFQQKNNRDLAEKLQLQFADNIRTRYNVQVGIAQANFAEHLAFRTGYDLKSLKLIQYLFLLLKDGEGLDDEQLFALHNELEKFYKHS